MANITREKLAQLMANARLKREAEEKAKLEAALAASTVQAEQTPEIPPEDKVIYDIIKASGMDENPKQIGFVKLVLAGKSCVLIGAAGTGKTTAQGFMAHCMQAAGKLPPLREDTKWLRAGTPGIAITSFTNKAVNNIRWKMPKDLQANCVTIHKLLEFAPVWYDIEDPVTHEYRKTMRFEPQRHRHNPLPPSLKVIVMEESSMIGTELNELLLDACPHNPQIVMLGDLYQLPPVYGTAILGYRLNEWPVVELDRIYRQALESPIISFAWKIKNGEIVNPATAPDPNNAKRVIVPSYRDMHVPAKLGIIPWQTRLNETNALLTAIKLMTVLYEVHNGSESALSDLAKFSPEFAGSGGYDPEQDIILIPFNKSFGSVELNNGISNYLGKKRGAIVHEIIAGFRKHYLAVGDKVLYEKEDYVITDITANAEYTGKSPQPASKTLDRWGHEHDTSVHSEDTGMISEAAIEKFMNSAANIGDEDKTNLASHTIVMQRSIDNEEVEIDSSGDVNNIIGGYAITVHKAQGSEWRRVFCVFHHTHAVMLCRELLYTAVTRARESLFVICEADTFDRGIKSQKIKGTTLAEKAEFFKGKQKEKEIQMQLEEKLAARASAPKVIMVKIEDLPEPDTKRQMQEALDIVWTAADRIWGDKIGKKPVLSYNMARKDAVGMANIRTGVIKMNAVFLSAESDPGIVSDMIVETLPHEAAHIIAARVFREFGHGNKWAYVMTMLGKVPRIHTNKYPPMLEARYKAVMAKFAQIRGSNDETINEEGDFE